MFLLFQVRKKHLLLKRISMIEVLYCKYCIYVVGTLYIFISPLVLPSFLFSFYLFR